MQYNMCSAMCARIDLYIYTKYGSFSMQDTCVDMARGNVPECCMPGTGLLPLLHHGGQVVDNPSGLVVFHQAQGSVPAQ